MKKVFFSLILSSLLYACSTAPLDSGDNRVSALKTKVMKNPDQHYLELQKRASEDDVTLNYDELRYAFSQSSFYKPYTSDERNRVEAAFVLSAQKKSQECLQTANELLETNYISLGGHYVSVVCARDLELDDKAYLHEEILEGLLNSITNSGDGKSVETAYLTYTTEELYTFLQINGLKVKQQQIVNDNNRVYDAMQVSPNGMNEEFTLYFDVTPQWKKSFLEK